MRHPEIGFNILKGIGFLSGWPGCSLTTSASTAAASQTARLEIHIGARIFMVAARSTRSPRRPYRKSQATGRPPGDRALRGHAVRRGGREALLSCPFQALGLREESTRDKPQG